MKLSSIKSYLDPKNLMDSFSIRDFSKAISMVIAMLVPIIIGIQVDQLTMAIQITLGVILASFSDTSGSLRLKVNGMLLGTLLVLVVTFIMFHIRTDTPIWLFLTLLGILIFTISYFSVYGFRASLISFSG
ncbi:MAG TPA: hypothetical protein VK021_10850, partial [Flavobacteriaceae bacterium]|nr:hypothetical protein [Flavobacteriaceae bacterium]